MSVSVYISVCVCVSVWASCSQFFVLLLFQTFPLSQIFLLWSMVSFYFRYYEEKNQNTCTHAHTHICHWRDIHMCVCLCTCVCAFFFFWSIFKFLSLLDVDFAVFSFYLILLRTWMRLKFFLPFVLFFILFFWSNFFSVLDFLLCFHIFCPLVCKYWNVYNRLLLLFRFLRPLQSTTTTTIFLPLCTCQSCCNIYLFYMISYFPFFLYLFVLFPIFMRFILLCFFHWNDEEKSKHEIPTTKFTWTYIHIHVHIHITETLHTFAIVYIHIKNSSAKFLYFIILS